MIDIDLLKRVYRDFSEGYAGLPEKEKVKLIQLLIKEISVCENTVRITLYYLPEIALNIKEELPGLYQPTIKLQVEKMFKPSAHSPSEYYP